MSDAPPGPVALIRDGYHNLMSRLGVPGFDRAASGRYGVAVLDQGQLEAAYRSSWLTRKVHDLPPYEMTRAGRAWQTDDDNIELLEAAEKKYKLWPLLFKALVTARLHGGAAIVMGVLGAGSHDQPLDPERVKQGGLRYLALFSRHQLTAPEGFDLDPESDYFNAPKMWEIKGARGNTVKVHPSRVLTFHGTPMAPGMVGISQLDSYWGDPLLASIKTAIDNAESTQAAVATLLHELKQDAVFIPKLAEKMATAEKEAQLARRVEALSTFKSLFNTLLFDGGDGSKEGVGGERWETRQLSFAQMPELLREFVGIVAGAADIPVTRLMGQSPGGMQSTGKGEQVDFNRGINAKQSFEIAPVLEKLDPVLLRSALGTFDPEIYYEFAPLAEPDPAEAATIEKTEAETIQIYNTSNLLPRDALAKTVANRLMESGRWPGLEAAIDESDQELGAPPEPTEAELLELEVTRAGLQAANENTVQEMEKKKVVTRDQAIVLLSDASPRPLYVRRQLINAAEVIAWAKGQGFTSTLAGDDMHATIVYSRSPVDWIKAGTAWDGDDKGRLTIKPGGPRLVEPLGDKGAVVLLFASSELTWRHETIAREAGASWDYNEYQPHVTLTYEAPEGLDVAAVEPYQGKLVFGPEIFEEIADDWSAGITER